MKGVIASCLADLVKTKFGQDKWRASLEKAGLRGDTIFLAGQNIPDEVVMKVVGSVCDVLQVTLQQAADAFGTHWVNTFAPKIYSAYYGKKSSAKEFLLAMNQVHDSATATIPNAKPPRFDFDWKNDKTVVMTYHSERGLIDFLVGLVKGVGVYFKEDLKVTKLDSTHVEVVFSK
jgi:hypothetical protein